MTHPCRPQKEHEKGDKQNPLNPILKQFDHDDFICCEIGH